MKSYTLPNLQTLARTTTQSLTSGTTFALSGDLGAGKTTFVQFCAQELGLPHISSPTFILMNIQKIPRHPFLRYFCHVDAYRIHHPQELVDIGLMEYLHDKKTVCFIEWAEKIVSLLPKKRIELSFFHNTVHSRKIQIRTMSDI